MRLTYNVVIDSNVTKVWDILSNLENQNMLLGGLTIEKKSDNSYVFRFKKKSRIVSYHTVLLEKDDLKKLSFYMNNKHLKVINTFFLSNNGIETYIKFDMDIMSSNFFRKFMVYSYFLYKFRAEVKKYFALLQKKCKE